MLCDKNVNLSKSIITKTQKDDISRISKNINAIYKQIKTNENKKTIKKNTGDDGDDGDDENDENGIKIPMAERSTDNKMDLIAQFEEEFTPRVQS